MYLRHSTRRKNGKTHTYWRLVRSVRHGSKVVQQTVAHLGELDAEGCAKARKLARHITGYPEQPTLFEPPPLDHNPRIRLNDIRLERPRRFGDVWLGLTLWQALRLDELCEKLLPHGREDVPWATMAAILVIARLCEPSSELHIAEDWYRKTALEDLLGVGAPLINDDRLYRALDQLLPHKVVLEQHLRQRLGDLFSLEYDLLLYDVTSTYFEGQARANRLARQGYSRDHRPDCKQVCIALVVTRDGMPVGYELFAGNRVDVTTVEEIVGTMETRFGLAKRIWVMDRGMVSEENVAWLKQSGRSYILAASRTELRRWSHQLADERDWMDVRDGIEVKLCQAPGGEETFVLCRSAERREKEQAMHGRFVTHIEDGLKSLARRLAHATKLVDRGAVERQIGRLLQRNSRGSGRFAIRVEEDRGVRSGLRLVWTARPEWAEWARHSEGCYVLRTNVRGWTPESLWKAYIQLTDAESAFRIHKSDLSIRPVWHQLTERVQAHILVCFLAYVMWKTLDTWCQRAGLGNSPRKILEELSAIQSTDVILPTAEASPRDLRIRCVVRPERAQAILLAYLGLKMPARLRVAPATAWGHHAATG